MAGPRNHYSILNVAPDAEPVVIEAAYRALMKKYHPDQGAPPSSRAPSAAEINNAFAVLRDPQRRDEYDHKEWTRSQAIQLAQYRQALPPPARRSNFFGWGGWLVALLLAGAIGIIASRSIDAPPIVRLEPAKSAALAPPDLRSQPSTRTPVAPAELAQIRSDALLGPPEVAGASASAPQAPMHRTPRPHPIMRRRGGSRATSADKDFVERHGGIY
jgi:curved DNA-binding protein CbpA